MTFKVEAQARKEEGTGASRRLRKAGRVPCVVYGLKKEAMSISVDANQIYYDLQKPDFHTKIVELVVDGKSYNVIVRDYQMHPWKKIVMHVDFQIVEGNEEIRIRVPFEVRNAAISPAVKLQGGRVAKLATTVELVVKANAIPEFIEYDASAINSGEIIHLDKVALPAGTYSPLLKKGINPAVCLATGKKGPKGGADEAGEEEAAEGGEEQPAAE